MNKEQEPRYHHVWQWFLRRWCLHKHEMLCSRKYPNVSLSTVDDDSNDPKIGLYCIFTGWWRNCITFLPSSLRSMVIILWHLNCRTFTSSLCFFLDSLVYIPLVTPESSSFSSTRDSLSLCELWPSKWPSKYCVYAMTQRKWRRRQMRESLFLFHRRIHIEKE